MKWSDLLEANERIGMFPICDPNNVDVMHRILAFRSNYPDGRIVTREVQDDGGYVKFVAEVHTDNGMLLSTASAKLAVGPDSSQRCEELAVNRALAFCGFGLTA